MQDKFEFNKLAEDMQLGVAASSPSRELRNLMLSKKHYSLFNPMLNIRKFLHHVVRGEYDAVCDMLKKDVTLIFKKESVIDYSGRTFVDISGFEYALWALDKRMWTTMLDCLPQNEESEKMRAILLKQYRKVDSDGVNYWLNSKKITEKHFDFTNTIIKELQTQVDSKSVFDVEDESALDKQWREGVGGAQKLLPMHVVYEYCSKSEPKLSRQFYNWTTEKLENWFGPDSKLAKDFAIYKGITGLASTRTTSPIMTGFLTRELDAIKVLCKVRTTDFINLKLALEKQMNVDNQFLVMHP